MKTSMIAARIENVMTLRSVSDWARHGGTFLRSSRSQEFRTEAGVKKAASILDKNDIHALVPIGGDGTLHGAVDLANHWSGKIIGCPGTIDNDLIGTDFTIGFATAVDTVLKSVDRIRDTAESHERMFLIEVMGRHSGFIAVHSAIACSAEIVCVPETPTDIDAICKDLNKLKQRGKTSIMMVVAEGDENGGVASLDQQLKDSDCPFSTRQLILGHLQRGGSPTHEDRLLGSQTGRHAVLSILAGETGKMAGVICGKNTLTSFAKTFDGHKPIPTDLLELIGTLSH